MEVRGGGGEGLVRTANRKSILVQPSACYIKLHGDVGRDGHNIGKRGRGKGK